MAVTNKRKRMSAFQIMLFSSGNVMGDLVLAVFQSYMLTFQTKVLGLPSNIVGLLWLIPSAIDAFVALLIGHMSDRVTIPFMSRSYGRRKSWHLIGCILYVITFPLLLMTCFPCGANMNGWQVTLYYLAITTVCYFGWDFTQANFLALIPEVASKQSEMVKLGAVSSAVTLVCGVFVYLVMWVLLGSDANSSLSEKQQPEFMKLGLIIIGTGTLFEILFHIGVPEPNTVGVCRSIRTKRNQEKSERHAELEPKDETVPKPSINGSCHTNHSFVNVEDKVHEKKEEDSTKVLREMLKKTLPDERMSKENDDGNSLDSDDGYTSEGLSIADSDNFELFMPGTFIDMVPVPNVILSSRRQSRVSGIGQFMSSSRGPSRTASRKFHRSPSQKRRTSTDIIEERQHGDSRRGSRFTNQGLDGSRRPSNMCQQPSWDDHRVMSRQTSRKRWESSSVNQFPSRNASVKKPQPINELTLPQDDDCARSPAKVRLSLTPELISEQFVINQYVEDTLEDTMEEDFVEEKPWKKLLRNPQFYKLGFAYMFTRLSQNMTNSYMPLFLTDWLQYPKIAIAYFPIVILISGVVASFGGKKLNTLLGNKWTFCLGSIMVMGASGWFYLLTPENRSVMYVPAILTGCGTSIMFVTTLALAADFVNADRKSGAFLMASMGLLAKIFNGTVFCLLQEFTPKQVSDSCPECISYVRHVFSLGPGVSAFFGLLAFILFIPATIQCKPIVQLKDAETQTDELSFTVSQATVNEGIDDQVAMPTHGISCFKVIEEDVENETVENPVHEEESAMNTAL